MMTTGNHSKAVRPHPKPTPLAEQQTPFFHHALIHIHTYHTSTLGSTGLLKQLRQLTLLGLQVAVAADVGLLDVDVGHRALARDLLERALDLGAVVCILHISIVSLLFFFLSHTSRHSPLLSSSIAVVF